ncbi:MAG: hypothetical protein IJ106_11965 [Parasporobacterium sp.]|nr:hypothetical protein [Parasporobacterium sp.]
MAKFNGWKKRYSYLDDYKKGMDGTYVYYGRHYLFSGSREELQGYKWTIGITALLLVALFIIGGIMDAGAVWNTWYVILPYALEAVLIFLLIWKGLTLIVEKNPVKAYIYNKTVPWLRPCGLILAGICVISLIAALICLLTKPDTVKLTGCLLYMGIKVLTGICGYLFAGRMKRYRWEPDPSEEIE